MGCRKFREYHSSLGQAEVPGIPTPPSNPLHGHWPKRLVDAEGYFGRAGGWAVGHVSSLANPTVVPPTRV